MESFLLLVPITMDTKTRVLIVDDHPFIREGLRFYLQDEQDFEVVGEAADGQEAIDRALDLHPDVVIMDIKLPVFDGLEATRRLRQALPSTQVLVLSVEKRVNMVAEAQEAGALGWITKDSSPSTLIHALECIRCGQPVSDQSLDISDQ